MRRKLPGAEVPLPKGELPPKADAPEGVGDPNVTG